MIGFNLHLKKAQSRTLMGKVELLFQHFPSVQTISIQKGQIFDEQDNQILTQLTTTLRKPGCQIRENIRRGVWLKISNVYLENFSFVVVSYVFLLQSSKCLGYFDSKQHTTGFTLTSFGGICYNRGIIEVSNALQPFSRHSHVIIVFLNRKLTQSFQST